MIHSCSLRIFPGRGDNISVNIEALDIRLHIRIQHVLRLFPGVFPAGFRNQILPLFRQKCTVPSGSHMSRHHGRLNTEGSAPAERIRQYSPSLPGSQHDKGRSKRFCDRCLNRRLAVASLVQRNSGCVQADRNHILHQRNPNRKIRSVLRKPLAVVFFLQPLNHCLFHNRLDIRRAEQPAFDRICLSHPEFSVLRNIPLPRNCPGGFKQLIKGDCPELPYLEKNPLRCPEEEIGISYRLRVSGKSHLSVLYMGDLVPKICNFSLCLCFQPEMAGSD